MPSERIPLPPAADLIGVSAAARLLDVSVSAIHRLIKKKKLRSWRVPGCHHRLSRAAVLALIETTGPEAEAAAPRPAFVSSRFASYGGQP